MHHCSTALSPLTGPPLRGVPIQGPPLWGPRSKGAQALSALGLAPLLCTAPLAGLGWLGSAVAGFSLAFGWISAGFRLDFLLEFGLDF